MTFFKNITATVFGLLLSLLLLEVALQIHNPLETRLKGDRITLPVNKRYEYKNTRIPGLDPIVIHTKNSLGFRGEELPPNGLDGRLAIIAVGGSTTECQFQSDGKDWPAKLSKILLKKFPNVWVNNAGLDGHSTYGHQILLEEFLVKLKPKLILFLIGANEMGESTERIEHTAQHIKQKLLFSSLEGFVKSASAYSEVMSLALNLYRFGRAWRMGLPHSFTPIKDLPQIPYPEQGDILNRHQKLLPSFMLRLQGLVKTARRYGIEPVLITQPRPAGGGIDPRTKIDLNGIKWGNMSGHTLWQVQQLYNDVTRKVGLEEKVLVIDLAIEMPKDSDLFYDSLHFTNKGSEVVAKVVSRVLIPFLGNRFSAHND